MDLGIRGRWALVCASSKGLGLGCAESLAAEGVNLVMNARGAQVLEEQAKRLASQYGVTVHAIAGDITTEDAGDVLQVVIATEHFKVVVRIVEDLNKFGDSSAACTTIGDSIDLVVGRKNITTEGEATEPDDSAVVI
ncbi:MAG: SDR family NAD(P)-dependent oxidoreductase, partial [Betaproteobacteria bacterium]|nr:SDR family NAD(P)-dependent oxidoreductase [Betaproteobacteria bacterium]